LKYVKTSFDKKSKFRKIELKIIQTLFFVSNVLILKNLFYFVGLRHTFMSEFLPVMGMHWGIRYCIYSCKYLSDRPTTRR